MGRFSIYMDLISDRSEMYIKSYDFRPIMHGAKRERILRVLLNQPDGSLTKYRLAKLSETTKSWVIDYLRILENKGLVRGTKILDKEALLDHWHSIVKKPRSCDFFVPSPNEFLLGIDMDYALTTYVAENLQNHYLFPSRTDIYVREVDLPLWKKKITKDGLVGKGNLRLLIYDEHVFYQKQKVNDLWVVSMPQLLLDLRREGGVCQEAYEMMVEKYVR